MTKSQFRKVVTLFLCGGLIYLCIEVIWRAIIHSTPTHYAMFIVGGIAFVVIGAINEYISWDMPLFLQCIIGTLFVYIIEFISGCVFNLWLNLNIWDYSNNAFNLLGQICPQFIPAWFMLSFAAILLDDYLRFILFGEDKPKYKLF